MTAVDAHPPPVPYSAEPVGLLMAHPLAYAALAAHALLIAAAVWLCSRYSCAFRASRPACLLRRKTEARYWALMASILTSGLSILSVAACLAADHLRPGRAGMTLTLDLAWLAAATLLLFHLLSWREMRRRYGP